MLVEQISVFIENKQGRLYAISETLAKNNVDISALSLAENEEYGVIRMIVSEPHKAKEVLSDSGVVCKVSKVLAVAIDDTPGGFSKAIKILNDENIEINYMYACVSHEKGKAIMIFSTNDNEKADKLLSDGGNKSVKPSSIYRI